MKTVKVTIAFTIETMEEDSDTALQVVKSLDDSELFEFCEEPDYTYEVVE